MATQQNANRFVGHLFAQFRMAPAQRFQSMRRVNRAYFDWVCVSNAAVPQSTPFVICSHIHGELQFEIPVKMLWLFRLKNKPKNFNHNRNGNGCFHRVNYSNYFSHCRLLLVLFVVLFSLSLSLFFLFAISVWWIFIAMNCRTIWWNLMEFEGIIQKAASCGEWVVEIGDWEVRSDAFSKLNRLGHRWPLKNSVTSFVGYVNARPTLRCVCNHVVIFVVT